MCHIPHFQRILDFNPKNPYPRRYLVVAYSELGRDQDAKTVFDPIVKSGTNLRKIMNLLPKKIPEIRDRYARAYLRAGLPGEPGGYYKILPDHRLAHEEIKDLAFGHTVTGFDSITGKQWRIDRTIDGKATYKSGERLDSGKSWIENNMLCNQWQELYEGQKDCMPIFKNPEPRSEKDEEYLSIPVYGVYPFSVVE